MKSPWIKKIANIYFFFVPFTKDVERREKKEAISSPPAVSDPCRKRQNTTTATFQTWPPLNCFVTDRPAYLKLRDILIS